MPPFLFHVKHHKRETLMLYVTLADVKAHLRIDGNDDCLCHGLLLNKRQTPAAVKAYGGLFDCNQNEFIRSR